MEENIIETEVEIEETTEEPEGIFVKAGIAVQGFVDNTVDMFRNNWKKILIGGVIAGGAAIGTGFAVMAAAGGGDQEGDYDYDGDLELEVITEIPSEIEVEDTTESDDSND